MNVTLKPIISPELVLPSQTAKDLMTPDPVSISDVVTVKEAIAMLTDRGYSGAPVIDEAGRAVGVLSRSDILVHDRESNHGATHVAEEGEAEEECPPGFYVEHPDRTLVREIMTPVVYSVSPDTPAAQVVEDMVALKVHRLFVVDGDGVLVGVISALDVLKHLEPR